jgi:hypothetical protein
MNRKPNVTPFAAPRKSPTRAIVRRREVNTGAFTAQQRETVIEQFHKQHFTVAQIAVGFREREKKYVGYCEIEEIIRLAFWRETGRRKVDAQAREAARLMGKAVAA